MPHAARFRPEPLRVRRGVVGVVIENGRLLVIRRSKLVRSPGMFCFPGGGIEEGETEPQALEREMLEELAVQASPLHRLWVSETPTKVQLAWWLAKLEPGIELKPHPAEVETAQWLDLAEIRGLTSVLPSNLAFFAAWRTGEFELPGLDRSAWPADIR
jgi:8-oxo-dGTP pyrophosphatase MutT (NUDIX family)